MFYWNKDSRHANDNSMKHCETNGMNLFGDTVRSVLPTATLLFREDIRIKFLFRLYAVSRDTRHSCCTIGWHVANIGQRHPQSGIDWGVGMQSQPVTSHHSFQLLGKSPLLDIIKKLQFKFYSHLPSVRHFVHKLNLEFQHLGYRRAESQTCSYHIFMTLHYLCAKSLGSLTN